MKKLNNLILVLLALSSYTYAKDEKILSDDRLNLFKLEQEKVVEDSAKLKKDWINPIQYQFTKNLGEEYKTEKSVITVNQPIFKSGGIYKAIKYANATYDYGTISIEQQKKLLVTQALNYLFMIKKTELNLEKAKLSVLNAQIDVNRKKEQVLNGFLDSSYLDNAILALNSAKHTMIDLKYQKQELINNFHNISSEHYTKFELPQFELFSKDEFLKRNIEIQKQKAEIEQKDNYSYMTISKYLPTVNAFYNYSKNHYTDGNPTLNKESSETYGITITMPLDSRTFNDIESSRIDYLKSKLSLKNTIKDEETFFKTKLDKISMLDERIAITNEDLHTYESILKIIEEEKEAQLKTQSDVETLRNSQMIKSLDLRIYNLDKQIELLEVYAKLN